MSANPQKTVYIKTFGCQMNEHDSSRIFYLLEGLGYSKTDSPKGADLLLFNTCTIREKANHKALSDIGRAEAYKRNKPSMLIAVCGCVAQEVGEQIFKRYPHVNIIFGPDEIFKLPELITEAQNSNYASALELINDSSSYVFVGNKKSSTTALPSEFVPIMKGCNCACSYCIVPIVRGKEVYKGVHKVVEEIAGLVDRGTKEVMLLGQNVNSYHDKESDTDFARLVSIISKETGIERIRFTSPHPRDVTDDLIAEYAHNKKLMPHIHLPVQSGSNSVLKAMKRGYTRERYLEITGALKKARSGFSVTTDLIVGFCGETQADFKDTLDLMNEVSFDNSFSFKYSPRKGTFAYEKLADDVPEEEKARRLDELQNLQKNISEKNNAAMMGKTDFALAYEKDKMGKGLISGRLEDNRIIHFAADETVIGTIVKVAITGVHANSLSGEIL